MTMIQKVAQAIADNINAGLPDGVEIDARYAAFAAIEAMRPTDIMDEAGALYLCEKRMNATASGCFEAMIQAALNEGQVERT